MNSVLGGEIDPVPTHCLDARARYSCARRVDEKNPYGCAAIDTRRTEK
jgi:hypothetical protein